MMSSPEFILKISCVAAVLAAAYVVSSCGVGARALPDAQQVDAGDGLDAGEKDTETVPDAEEPPPVLDVEVLPPTVSDCSSREGMIGARLKDGECFLIDAKKVTRGQYYDALRRNELKPASHPACGDVNGFGPRLDWDPESRCGGMQHPYDGPLWFPWPPSGDELSAPMGCVNWCDALAYCESQGKRLCHGGREEDGSVSPDSLNRAARDEWFSACTAAGTRKYPYGDSELSREQCKDHKEICEEGGYAGLYGMASSFHVEFANNCDDETDSCIFRGNTSARSDSRWACEVSSIEESEIPRIGYGLWVGFRCCADP